MNSINKKQSNYLAQGAILASASIVVRMIGLLYRIPVTRIIGDVGNSYYSCAFEIYSLILLISSYSLPLAVSKIVSAKIGMGEKQTTLRILKCALGFAAAVGLAGALFAYFGADFLAGTLLNTPEGAVSLRVLAPCIFVVAILGVIRGYFQGMGTMVPTAVSQILEQVINAVTAVAAAYFLFGYGAKIDAVLGTDTAAAAYGASGSTLGTTLGALTALIFMSVLLGGYVSRLNRRTDLNRTATESYGEILKILVLTIVPVILSTAIYNLNGIIDQGMFKSVMLQLGNSKDEVDNLWGIYSGKYKLLCNVPIALASAMASSAIPTISRMNGDKKGIRKKVGEVIRFTMVISIPCAFGLAVYAEPILKLLWPGEIEAAVRMLQIGSVSVVFYSLSTLTNGILQGIDRMRLPVIHAAVSLGLHIILFYVLLAVFHLEGDAIVYAYVFFGACMCILNGLAIKKYLRYRQEIRRTFVIPLISAIVMSIVSKIVYNVLYVVLGEGTVALCVALLVGVMLAVVIYFTVLLAMRGIRERELRAFPKGHLLVKIAKKLHFHL